MTRDPLDELARKAAERRFAGSPERTRAASELSILVEEATHYDTLLELAAPSIARNANGGCVIALLSDDGSTLHPLGFHHPEPAANDVLDELIGLTFEPMAISRLAMEEGRPQLLELDPAMFAERPGVGRYIDLTGDTHALVTPLRALGRSLGVMWFAARRPLDSDDANFLSACAARLAVAVELLRYRDGDMRPKSPATAGPLAVLTAREREILAMVAEGLTSREVAERLVVSVRTVEWHRARLQAKLGVSGRSKLTSIARDAGLLPPVP